MCKVEMLRVLVKQRLTAAVEEIFVVLERTIAEYEEELSRRKEENERQRQLLDALFNKHQQTGAVRIAEGDDGNRHQDISEEHPLPEQQECNSSVEQEEPRSPHFKEEEEEHTISQVGEHLGGLHEFPVVDVPVKSEEDEVKGESEAGRPSSSSTQHMTTEALTRHMRTHTDKRPFICSVCGQAFLSMASWTEHTRTHSGEKPFACSVCDQSFSVKANLRSHMRTHIGQT
ncbi:zinc finger protein 892-like isoform X3 [Nerophis ophidion]|uniref:zinc finger protein 892-like isoform X3 n=1 Tax=Nerophis ophidion TaxID=159077 RepID=UPI002AE0265D|nr:zinc finger protein 892-like isoform X3 [Nerophis ophidion]